MITYDPTVIQTMAKKLYQQARSIVVTHVALGTLVGAAAGFLALSALENEGALCAAAAAGLLGGALGFSIAQPKAFLLRLQAQTALCQVQIEENTRRVG